MKINDVINEGKRPGLWANIHAKRERIKHGSGEHMRKPGSKGAPTAQAFKNSQTDEAANPAQQAAIAIAMKKKGQKPKKMHEADDNSYDPFANDAEADARHEQEVRAKMQQQLKQGQGTSLKSMNPIDRDQYLKNTNRSWDEKTQRSVPAQTQNTPITKTNEDEEYDDEAGMIKSNLRTSMRAVKGLYNTIKDGENCPEWVQEKIAIANDYLVTCWDYLISEHEERKSQQQFDMIEEMVESWAQHHGVDSEMIWEDIMEVDDNELLSESEAWQKKSGKNKNGGLNAKGVASYRRSHPGSKLQTAVTTKPSKLKKGSKAAKRRKSFCARMSGVKGPMKKPNGKPTRKALALRKWNC
jgi:hypothetical protein